MIQPFSLTATGNLTFGAGVFGTLSERLAHGGYRRVSVVVSASSASMGQFSAFIKSCESQQIKTHISLVTKEPSVSSVDTLAAEIAERHCDAVVGIGGGSVLDTAKAVSVMARVIGKQQEHISVKRYLEGVGDLVAPSGRLPLIAVPTTAGTGSEATKNAVIAEIGPKGFKKSLRHDSYIPDLVILDPQLALSVGHAVTAASGLDALTQLLEAYVSVQANPYVDSLALEAIGMAGNALPVLLSGSLDRIDCRAHMTYAAYISGVSIAHAGLGYVHGLAGPLGGLHEAPHGVLCGSLIGPIHRAMVEQAQRQNDPPATAFLEKLARIAYRWGVDGPQGVVDHIARITDLADLPKLESYGFTSDELSRIGTTNPARNSPVSLETAQLIAILSELR